MFSVLSEEGFISSDEHYPRQIQQKHAISSFKPNTPEHWLEVCNSVLKHGVSINDEEIQRQLRIILNTHVEKRGASGSHQ